MVRSLYVGVSGFSYPGWKGNFYPKDLKSEDFSTKFEAEDREPPRDLNSELFSAKLEAELIESLRALARPLI